MAKYKEIIWLFLWIPILFWICKFIGGLYVAILDMKSPTYADLMRLMLGPLSLMLLTRCGGFLALCDNPRLQREKSVLAILVRVIIDGFIFLTSLYSDFSILQFVDVDLREICLSFSVIFDIIFCGIIFWKTKWCISLFRLAFVGVRESAIRLKTSRKTLRR